MSLIVYADFSSPECYLASRRADALVAAGAAIDWRVVERAPHMPVTGTALSPADQTALREHFVALDGVLLARESLPFSMPSIVPKTEASVSAYAEAYGAGVADDVRRLLFDMYWQQGADIGSPTVLREPLVGPILRAHSASDPLREFGYAVNANRGPITSGAYRRISAWRDEWEGLGSPEPPVVLSDGATLSGADALRRLGKQMAYVAADPAPVLGDPRRYPDVSGRPQAAWVSQTGGRWSNVYRLTGAM